VKELHTRGRICGTTCGARDGKYTATNLSRARAEAVRGSSLLNLLNEERPLQGVLVAPVFVVGNSASLREARDIEAVLDIVEPKHALRTDGNRPEPFTGIAPRRLRPLKRHEICRAFKQISGDELCELFMRYWLPIHLVSIGQWG
jgi:hypothetical protein